ncbi:MAG: YkgJ family cysteine cluster protein [Rhodospirillales bacterium]|nr:YkgJ family cysteine cluster protein [Rhodospirillales bacterium]
MPISEEISQAQAKQVQLLLDQTKENLHRMTVDILGTEPTIEKFMILMNRAFEISDILVAQLKDMFPVEKARACKEGCDFCCTGSIVMTKPAFAIYSLYYAKTNNDGAYFDYAVEQLKSGRQYCYFLKDNACPIYPARPFVCRVFNSFDFNECLNHRFQHSGTRADIGLFAVFEGVEAGLTDLSLDNNNIAFNSAIKLMISEDSIAEKWLAGEKIFKPCYIESRE